MTLSQCCFNVVVMLLLCCASVVDDGTTLYLRGWEYCCIWLLSIRYVQKGHTHFIRFRMSRPPLMYIQMHGELARIKIIKPFDPCRIGYWA